MKQWVAQYVARRVPQWLRCSLIAALAAAIMIGNAAVPALAHKPSDSYLTLSVQRTQATGRWDVALRDLDYALGLDADDDGRLTWGEVRARWAEMQHYVLTRLDVRMGGVACGFGESAPLLDQHTDGTYAVFDFSIDCLHPTLQMEVAYRLFFDLDPQHRGLAKVQSPEGVVSAIFSPEHRQETVIVGASLGWGVLLAYAHEGMHHIWAGFDHLLFLVALLLPSVLRRDGGQWAGAASFRAVALDVATIVTAFTVAHSITLSLAVLQVVTVPSRLVESIIALSVAAAAINNVVPLVSGRRWLVAFGFGLVHGFGFAGALSDLGLVDGAKALALGGFNLGVEVGQAAVVAMLLPIAYGLRNLWVYQRLVVVGGSCAIVLVALGWAVERWFEVTLLQF